MVRKAQFVLGLAALVGAALASSSAGQGPPPGAGPPGGPPGLDKAIAAKEKNANKILDKPGVVGIGVGLNPAGKPVIHVYKERKEVADIPESLDDVPVQQVDTGRIDPRAPSDRFPRPVPIGVSSGHFELATGTLGARVTNGTNVFALSNNHVYAGVDTASIGDPILQPGPIEDGGTDPADRIGTLYDVQPINFDPGSTNTIDAAIALTSTALVGTGTPVDGYGTPSSTTTTAFIGQPVQKYGRTTGLQLGTVADINLTVDVCYFPLLPNVCLEEARFVNQFSVTPGPFSAPGDSGSLIVTQGTNQPVGLLFAGGDGLTIGNPIDAVLQRFNVTIDGGGPPPNGVPGAPTGLAGVAGDGQVALTWSAPSFDGGSPITGYRVYRGASPNPASVLTTLPVQTSFTDFTAPNGTTSYYRVAAVNASGTGPTSNEVSATPEALVPPASPLAIVDAFNRPNENPLTDGTLWTNSVIPGESGLYVTSNQLACSVTTTCTAWRNTTQYGPDVEVSVRVPTLPGNGNVIRLYARLQMPGATGGYLLRANQLSGTDQIWLERFNGGATTLLSIPQELSAGDTIMLRVKGTTLEAWRNDGSAWLRLGFVHDTTYSAAGYVGVGLRGTSGRLDDFGARSLGAATPPGAPTGLAGVAGDGQVALTWSAPSFDGGSPITGYRVYRGASPNPASVLTTLPVQTSFTDFTAPNGTTSYYRVAAVNASGTGPTSNEVSATPEALVPPASPLAIVDAFNRPNENPLTDGTLWTNSVIPGESGLYVTSNQLACSVTTTCTAWRNTTQYGPDVEVSVRVPTLPGNGNVIRLYARLQMPGATGGYLLRANQLSGTDQIWLERFNGGATTLLSIPQELSAGDTIMLRVKGTTLEAWRNDGSAWLRLGFVHDTTYSAAGYVGVGLRGTSGRLDDFGARSLGAATPPGAPTGLAGVAGDGQVALTWSAPASDGGSQVTGYKIYRSTTAGGEVLLPTNPSLITSTNYTDTTALNGTTYYYKVSAVNAVNEGALSNEAFATPSAPATPPSAPQNLQASAGNAQVALTWSAPASDGGSQVTGYKIYRSTTAGGEVLLPTNPSLITSTNYTDTTALNGTTYYYKVSAVNAVNEGALSNEAFATPTDLVPPVEPLTILDSFNRADENPLSFGGSWGSTGIVGNSERNLKVVLNQCASDRTVTATAWWTTSFGPDSEAYATVTTLPGNGNAVRLYVRLQSPGSSAVDGYMLLYNQLSGTDQVVLYRLTNGALTQLATANREVAAGNRLLLRAKGTGLEAWIGVGTTWTRLSAATDSTYTGAGYVGAGIRGKTGRLDDFGAR